MLPLPAVGDALTVTELILNSISPSHLRDTAKPALFASWTSGALVGHQPMPRSSHHSGSYVRLENRRFYAEKKDIVTERLQDSFSDILDYGFTATMEERLDEVAQGTLSDGPTGTSSTATSATCSPSRKRRSGRDAAQRPDPDRHTL